MVSADRLYDLTPSAVTLIEVQIRRLSLDIDRLTNEIADHEADLEGCRESIRLRSASIGELRQALAAVRGAGQQ